MWPRMSPMKRPSTLARSRTSNLFTTRAQARFLEAEDFGTLAGVIHPLTG